MKQFVIFQNIDGILCWSELIVAKNEQVIINYAKKSLQYKGFDFYISELSEDNNYKFEDKSEPGKMIEWDGFNEIGMN